MDSRETILSRLRGDINSGLPEQQIPASEEIFADYPPSDDLVAVFIERLSALRAKVRTAASAEQAGTTLLELIGNKNGFLVQGQLASALMRSCPELQNRLTILNENSLAQLSHRALSAFDVGVTEADAFIARTGSIAISGLDRRVSLLPAHHIVIGQAVQIIPSLVTWLSGLPLHSNWSHASIITGPSRTADIEKILVLGAHGPKELSIILLT